MGPTLSSTAPTPNHLSDETNATDGDAISAAISRAAHLLPTQGPIEVFVHHNTLHAFEAASFHDAVTSGEQTFGGRPYWPENRYRELYRQERITDQQLRTALQLHLQAAGTERVADLATREEIRIAMLRHPIHSGPDAELRWIVAETDALDRFRPETSMPQRERMVAGARRWLKHSLADATSDLQSLLDDFGHRHDSWPDAKWESFSLHLLWRICRHAVSDGQNDGHANAANALIRPRDILLQATGEDIDREAHDVLIRFCGAYLDQGYSDWPLPNRNTSFFEAFLQMYARPGATGSRWLRQLAPTLASHLEQRVTAHASIAASLRGFGFQDGSLDEIILRTLLALRGWAGMVWQLESGVDWVVHKIPSGSLTGLLAVQLLLEEQLVRRVGSEHCGEAKDASCSAILDRARAQIPQRHALTAEARAFRLFQVAQVAGWTPDQLSPIGTGGMGRVALRGGVIF